MRDTANLHNMETKSNRWTKRYADWNFNHDSQKKWKQKSLENNKMDPIWKKSHKSRNDRQKQPLIEKAKRKAGPTRPGEPAPRTWGADVNTSQRRASGRPPVPQESGLVHPDPTTSIETDSQRHEKTLRKETAQKARSREREAPGRIDTVRDRYWNSWIRRKRVDSCPL